ncbi:FtsX-like permease family protein [Homoserinibacter sp. YIM 151385]|uniref:FtsX-like permease family protein n=1 Tax=Homoserinibacter sp. YIM 151385 TaxID=2985506 RepID=UPI0022F0DBB6|nr:FtsX-like permease family protein [Homoserinibacter sp. YIM 151385]WBU37366.1 permease [Homoserinibacter sp. YIM 151385]
MIARLAWMLGRPGRGSLGLAVLPVAAFAVTTTLIMTVLGGAQAFWGGGAGDGAGDERVIYAFLAALALAILVVPLLSLGASAARLATRRRDDRLATLRLLGASTGTVSAITVLETGAQALIGGLLGWAGALALTPAIGLIHFRGAPLTAEAVILHPGIATLVVLGVSVVGLASAMLGLRRVSLSPLGVRMRSDAERSSWPVAVVGLAVLALAVTATSMIGGLVSGAAMTVGIGAFAATLAVLDLVGPWMLRIVARVRLRRASTPARLLAARRILDSPKDAWRQVSGVAMATFTAVFTGIGVAVLELAGGIDPSDPEGGMLLVDIRTGVIVTVVGAFLTVACSVGVNQAAGILDRRELNVSLDRMGVPLSTADAARRGAVLVPLLATSVWAAASAAIVVFPLAGIALIFNTGTLLLVVSSIGVGVLLVVGAIRATRPLLRATVASAG